MKRLGSKEGLRAAHGTMPPLQNIPDSEAHTLVNMSQIEELGLLAMEVGANLKGSVAMARDSVAGMSGSVAMARDSVAGMSR